MWAKLMSTPSIPATQAQFSLWQSNNAFSLKLHLDLSSFVFFHLLQCNKMTWFSWDYMNSIQCYWDISAQLNTCLNRQMNFFLFAGVCWRFQIQSVQLI